MLNETTPSKQKLIIAGIVYVIAIFFATYPTTAIGIGFSVVALTLHTNDKERNYSLIMIGIGIAMLLLALFIQYHTTPFIGM